HNPSSAFASDTQLKAIGDVAARVGAKVLVDEVYLDAVFDQSPKTSMLLGSQFVVTNSLTKAYGLSGVRCGWILAEPELARRIWHINDLHGATPAHPAELLSAIALDNLDGVATRAEAILTSNRTSMEAFLDSRSELLCYRPEYGTVYFPQAPAADTEQLLELLQIKYDTSVVPGKYFEMPDHFRVGIGGDPEMTREGLRRLGEALDEFQAVEKP